MSYTEIAKKAVEMTVALNVSAAVSTQIENHTDFDSDSIANQVGSFVIGKVVAKKARRFTDPAVETVASRIVAYRNRTKDTK